MRDAGYEMRDKTVSIVSFVVKISDGDMEWDARYGILDTRYLMI